MVGKVTARFAGVVALVLASGLGTFGCSRKSLGGDAAAGSVIVAISLPGGGIVNAVGYTLGGNGITPITGTIDVSAPGTTRATALVSGLASAAYAVGMKAVSSDGQTCAGSAPFTVVAGQTALVDVILQCTRVNGGGSVAINGRIDQCPVLTSISATRLQAPVGGVITIGAGAVELDPGDVVTYVWTAGAAIGTFGSTSAPTTTFTCNAVGSTALSIAITDGVCGDSFMKAIPIVCTVAAAGRNVVATTNDAPTPSQVIDRQGNSNYASGRAANVEGVAGLICPVECGF